MKNNFGKFVRKKREALKAEDKKFFFLQFAKRIGVEPSYLSKIERGDQKAYLTEEKIRTLADDLELDPDVLLALGGKISKDIQDIISKRPVLFAELIRELKNAPDKAVIRIVREVRDGEW